MSISLRARGIATPAVLVLTLACAGLVAEETLSREQALLMIETWNDKKITPEGWDEPYAARSLETTAATDAGTQLYAYETVDFQARSLFRQTDEGAQHEPIVRYAISPDRLLPGQPAFLVLRDVSRDGSADTFTLVKQPGESTMDFGFVFDLDRDGAVDYVVYNGGPVLMAPLQEFKGWMWMNYHLIDRNRDGRIDVLVYNDIDLSGDGYPDPGLTAWLYDDDFDGLIDRGEYLGYTARFPIAGAFWKPEVGTSFQQSMLESTDTLVLRESHVGGDFKEWKLGEPIAQGWHELLAALNEAVEAP